MYRTHTASRPVIHTIGVALLLSASGPARATESIPYIASTNSLRGGELVAIDFDSGQRIDRVSITASALVRDLASDPVRSPSSIWAVAGRGLFEIDIVTEQVLRGEILDWPDAVLGLAFNPVDGALYGAAFQGRDVITEIVAIDIETFEVSLVGRTSEPLQRALGFTEDGRMISARREADGSQTLVEVDTETVELTPIGDPVPGLAIRDLAVRPEDGVLYAYGIRGSDSGVFTVDPLTGELGSTVTTMPQLLSVEGLAFSFVPEPTTLGLAMVSLGLMSAKPRSARAA